MTHHAASQKLVTDIPFDVARWADGPKLADLATLDSDELAAARDALRARRAAMALIGTEDVAETGNDDPGRVAATLGRVLGEAARLWLRPLSRFAGATEATRALEQFRAEIDAKLDDVRQEALYHAFVKSAMSSGRHAEFHVVKAETGWSVLVKQAAVDELFERQEDAVRAAREIARTGDVRVVVHKADGSVRTSYGPAGSGSSSGAPSPGVGRVLPKSTRRRRRPGRKPTSAT